MNVCKHTHHDNGTRAAFGTVGWRKSKVVSFRSVPLRGTVAFRVTPSQTKVGSPMRAEYDFTGGVRGKRYHTLQGGYTITIHKADGTTLVKEVKPAKGAVILEPDVRKYFPDSDSVNATLRSLIRLIPTRKPITK